MQRSAVDALSQSMFDRTLRGRCIAVNTFFMAVAIGLGSLMWGKIADLFNLTSSLCLAAILTIIACMCCYIRPKLTWQNHPAS